MSAGSFLRSKYQASYNTTQIHPIRVQPETIAAAIGATTNAAPAGAQNNPISAVVSRGNRSRGLNPRKVRIQLTGTAPAGYATNSITTIPALTETFYNAAVIGVSVTYLSTTWQIVGKTPEYVK